MTRALAKRGAPVAASPSRAEEKRAAAPPLVTPKLTVMEIAALTIAVVLVIAAARVAEAFLVPVIAGILLSYALRPLVSALERFRVPRSAAAALVIAVLAGILSAAGYAVRDDFNAAVSELPGAARKLRIAVTEAALDSPGPISHVKEAAAELDRAAAAATGKPAAAPPEPAEGVAANIQGFVAEQSGLAFIVASQLVLAILLAYFLLAAGDTFRRKVAHLAGDSLARRRVTVEVMNEIDANVQRYLLALLVTNTLVALAVWGALAAMGLPNAGMWGVVSGVLHVIPYAGIAVATAGIAVAMFLHSGSIAMTLLAVAAVGAIATLIGIGFMTWMQGRAVRMNAVAVFVGVLFFGWLWGGWGLLLGLPILAVVKSIADRIEPLALVSELLSV
jgi:predicted PurR-regulated permease PerM